MTLSILAALNGAELLLRIDDTRLAAAALEAIGAVAPDAARLHLFSGWLQLREQKLSLAAKHFRLAQGRDPLEPLAFQGLAAALPPGPEQQLANDQANRLRTSKAIADLRRGKPYLARAPLELLHASHPDEQAWAILLAECLRRLGDVATARAVLREQLQRVPVAAPASLVAAALSDDEYVAFERLRDAARGDPAWITAEQLWAPDGPPFRLPPQPQVTLPPAVVTRLAEVGNISADDSQNTANQAIRTRTPVVQGKAGQPRGHTAKGAGNVVGPRQAQPAQLTLPADFGNEVADALTHIRRSSQRLFGQTTLPLGQGDTVALLLTHRASLTRRYGVAATDEIIRRMDLLRQILVNRGLRAEIMVLDDPSTIPGVQPLPDVTGNGGAQAIAEMLRRVRQSIIAHNYRLEAILLIGGDSIIPLHRLKNPVQDTDPALYSDNPYGSNGGSEHVPDTVVARFPDGGADGGALLLALLQRSIDYHEGWLVPQSSTSGFALPLLRRLANNPRAKDPVPAWGASTSAWQEPSEQIFREIATTKPLLFYPQEGPRALSQVRTPDWSNGRMLFFNLHGLSGGPNWYGQSAGASSSEPLPIAMTPGGIAELAPATICVSEACYGAEIMGRSPGDAIALRFLQQGALAFIGSTTTAYGAVKLPLGGADILAQQVFHNLRRGYPIGRALLLARDTMARLGIEEQGYLDPDDAKTLLSFVLLGDPWANPYVQSPVEPKSAAPAIEPVIAHREHLHLTAVSPAAAELARHLLAKIAPQFARVPLIAAGQSHPQHVAKGPGETYVFSADAQFITADGRHSEQIARVTVAHGIVQKVIQSR